MCWIRIKKSTVNSLHDDSWFGNYFIMLAISWFIRRSVCVVLLSRASFTINCVVPWYTWYNKNAGLMKLLCSSLGKQSLTYGPLSCSQPVIFLFNKATMTKPYRNESCSLISHSSMIYCAQPSNPVTYTYRRLLHETSKITSAVIINNLELCTLYKSLHPLDDSLFYLHFAISIVTTPNDQNSKCVFNWNQWCMVDGVLTISPARSSGCCKKLKQ